MHNSYFCAQKPGSMKGQLFTPSFAPLPALDRDDSVVSQLSHLTTLTPVVIFYCCIINFHKRSSLKRHIIVISLFLWICSAGMAQLGLLLNVSQDGNQDVSRTTFSSGGSTREGPASKFPQVIGRIHSLQLQNSQQLTSSNPRIVGVSDLYMFF